jgi:hypothetical protein
VIFAFSMNLNFEVNVVVIFTRIGPAVNDGLVIKMLLISIVCTVLLILWFDLILFFLSKNEIRCEIIIIIFSTCRMWMWECASIRNREVEWRHSYLFCNVFLWFLFGFCSWLDSEKSPDKVKWEIPGIVWSKRRKWYL